MTSETSSFFMAEGQVFQLLRHVAALEVAEIASLRRGRAVGFFLATSSKFAPLRIWASKSSALALRRGDKFGVFRIVGGALLLVETRISLSFTSSGRASSALVLIVKLLLFIFGDG